MDSVIVFSGMIGIGKSFSSELIGKELKSEVFFESVDDNPILPLFYTASSEEIESKRYPFLLQLHFLNTRFSAIKKALEHKNNVLDRSIYEDWYFAKKNMELGRISEMEFTIYEQLLTNMMEEIEGMPKKAPDILIYLKGSFETVMKRIASRGRDFEMSEDLRNYYYHLWSGYDEWVLTCYKASPILIVDMDRVDVVNSEADAKSFVKAVKATIDRLPLESGSVVAHFPEVI